jgi:ribosomal protein S18 acetylase RimI-like enzyme
LNPIYGYPCKLWQNSFEAIARASEDFIPLGTFDSDRLVGYVIFEPAAGDITQIAVSKTHRRQGIGSTLLGEMLRQNRAPGIKCINTEIRRDEALADFLQARNITLAGKLFEMIKKL